jgi:hypothetical protein
MFEGLRSASPQKQLSAQRLSGDTGAILNIVVEIGNLLAHAKESEI